MLADLLPNEGVDDLFNLAEQLGLIVSTPADSRLGKMDDDSVFKDGNIVIPEEDMKMLRSILGIPDKPSGRPDSNDKNDPSEHAATLSTQDPASNGPANSSRLRGGSSIAV